MLCVLCHLNQATICLSCRHRQATLAGVLVSVREAVRAEPKLARTLVIVTILIALLTQGSVAPTLLVSALGLKEAIPRPLRLRQRVEKLLGRPVMAKRERRVTVWHVAKDVA